MVVAVAGFSNRIKNGGKIIAAAHAAKRTEFFVKFHCRVVALLPDDLDGSRHQRFLVRTSTGLTLLVAHNIDLSARVKGLKKSTPLVIHGEYIWNEEGGIIHKTHDAMNSRDPDGWIRKPAATGKGAVTELAPWFRGQ